MLWLPQGYQPSRGAIDATVAASGSVWGDHGTHVDLSATTIANDTAAPNAGSFSTVRGTQARGPGLWYGEVKALSAGSGFIIIGLMDAATATGAAMDNFQLSHSLQHYSANGTAKVEDAGLGGFTGVDIGSGWSLANNDYMSFVYDGTNGFSYLALNGVYFLSGNPASGALGTGHVGAFATPPSLYPAISIIIDGLWQLKTTAPFSGALPAGASAWG